MSNMVVRTNVFALNAHRNMKNVGVDQSRASNRLSSGFRINSAADDAAGLAISESMRAQIRGLDQASRNTQDGQALVQTAEGGMQEIQNMVQRIRELTVQAANDTNSTENRNDHIRLEINQLLDEIDSMSERVQYNGINLLNGTAGVTADGQELADTINLAIRSLATRMASRAAGATSLPTVNLSAFDDTFFNERWIDIGGHTLLAAGSARRNALADALGGGYDSEDMRASLTALLAASTVAAPGSAADEEVLMRGLVALRDEFAGGLTFQVGANSGDIMRVNIADMRVFLRNETGERTAVNHAGLGGAMGDFMSGWETAFRTDDGREITELIDSLHEGIEFVSVARAELGAVSNRLDFTSRSLDISSENLSDAESRVRNTDMAREMMNFTMANVLQQASVSMLSQANQMPNNLLQLLR